MNQKQKEYAIDRLKAIANAALYEYAKLNPNTPKKELSPENRFKAFKKGEYKIKANITEINKYTDVCDILEFKGESKELPNLKYSKFQEKTKSELRFAEDQIMLGDSETALRIIEEFGKKYLNLKGE